MTLPAFHSDRPSVCLSDQLGYVETKAGALHSGLQGLVGAVEGLEDKGQYLGRDTDAMVFYNDHLFLFIAVQSH